MHKKSLLTGLFVAVLSTSACAQDTQQDMVKQEGWFDSGSNAVMQRANRPQNRNKAKNIIIFIGDGMGISTLTAARIREGQLRGELGEDNYLSFEKFPNTALVKTYATNAQVNDSAGTATAIFTGVKTNANVIGVNEHQSQDRCEGIAENSVTNLAEMAREKDMSVGIVTTARITHATPAAVFAHSPKRQWAHDKRLPKDAAEFGCTDIAAQMIAFDGGVGLDVAMGGGRYNFLPEGVGVGRRGDGQNLVEMWQNARDNRAYVENADSLRAVTVTKETQLMGLFSRSHLPYVLDRTDETPSLTDMALKAIEVLEAKGRPYVLLIEAGKVDLAHHRSWARKSLAEAVELSATVAVVTDKINLDETLVLVTADHSHSLTINGSDSSPRGTDILGFNKKLSGEYYLDEDGNPFTTLQYATGAKGSTKDKRILTEDMIDDKEYDYRGHVTLDEEKHTGEDVALFGIGPRSHVVAGTIEQNEVYHIMAYALGWYDDATKKK